MVAVFSFALAALAPAAGADHSVKNLVSTGPAGGNGSVDSDFGGISRDGTRVFFMTGEKLVAGDDDGGVRDVYQHFRRETTLISTGPAAGTGPLGEAMFKGVTQNGARVFFETTERLVDGDDDGGQTDVYMRSGASTALISTGPQNANAAVGSQFGGVSGEGRHFFFITAAALTADDTDADLDVYQRSVPVSTLTPAVLVSGGPNAGGGDSKGAFFQRVADDGSPVFFATDEPLVAGDGDLLADVYQRTFGPGGATTLVSTGPTDPDVAHAGLFRISADGTRVFFSTTDKLVAADTDSVTDLYERAGTATTLVSVGEGVGGNGAFDVNPSHLSLDGTRVTFVTQEKLSLADGDSQPDVYQRAGGVTQLLSRGTAGGNGAFMATFQGATEDGTRVFFGTTEKLIDADTDDGSKGDVYEWSGGQVTLVSTGAPEGESADYGFHAVSTDGARVLFAHLEPICCVGGFAFPFGRALYERASGATTSIAPRFDGAGRGFFGVGPLFQGASADGTRVFVVTPTALLPADTDTAYDVYAVRIPAPPETTIASGPDSTITDTTPAFEFSGGATATSFECRIDVAAFAACTSPFTSPPLSDGPHVFEVRAVDVEGDADQSPASRAFTVDTTAETTIDSGPAGTTSDPKPTFSFSSPDAGATFECRFDVAAFVVCASPFTSASLPDGLHTFAVRATDTLGNVDGSPASRTFTVDTSVTANCPTGTSAGVVCQDKPAGGLTITGTAGADRIVGSSANDTIRCGAGKDTVSGGRGKDDIRCGAGKDKIKGGGGKDRLEGQAGNDKVGGDAGNDRIGGGSGKDRLKGNAGEDRLGGGGGNDRLNTRDGTGGDHANCGENRGDLDRASVDTGDTTTGCERVAS
ncbi:MAG TPA: hypothetical protein VD790_09605 [Thermoleophilaceae bacterium]|nr:hypothetical protein [Thermoleophilaceae bacterium]